MLVLTMKDQHRIAICYQVHDEQQIIGWLKFLGPARPGSLPSWELLDGGGDRIQYMTQNFTTKIDTPDGVAYRFSCEVKPHSRTQYQANFAAPGQLRLVREKALEKHGLQHTY